MKQPNDILRFTLGVIAFLVIQGAIFAGMWAIARHDQRDSYLSVTTDKHARLDATASPRVIVAGGSSSAFGIRSDLLREALRRAPVNLSLHAGLGRSFMLGEIASAVRKDDLVLLSLEYHLYQQAPRTSPHVWAVLMERPAAIADLRFIPKDVLTDSGFQFIHHVSRTAFWAMTTGNERDPLYRRASFDPVGDFTAHYDLPPQRPYKAQQPRMKLSGPRLDRAVEEIRQLNAICERAGAKLVVFYPPFEMEAFKRDQEQIESLAKRLSRELPVASRVKDIPWSSRSFFDTEYHLTNEAAEQRTRMMIARLREAGIAP